MKYTKHIFYLLSFSIPLGMFAFTMADSVDFIDSPEFALVATIGSIAHPPGNPSYALLGWIWVNIFEIFSSNNILIVTLYSVFTSSLGALFFNDMIYLLP